MPPLAGVVALYTALAYAITWLGVSPLVARGLGLYDGPVPAWWHVVGAIGPVGAAFLTARITGGRDSVGRWWAAVSRYRIPARWWIVAAGSPFALLAIAVVAARLVAGAGLGAGLETGPATGVSWWASTALVSVAYGMGEEPGWRGFLLPQLMRRYSARAATLGLAVVWAAWHAPFFLYRYDFAGPATIFGFFTAMLAGACWLTFLYLSTGGSVPAVATWHVLWNVVNLLGAEMSDLVVGIMNGAVMVLGFGVLVTMGGGLRWPGGDRA